MKSLRDLLGKAYWVSLAIFIATLFFRRLTNTMDWNNILHSAYYLPAIAMLSIISGQFDLLKSIEKGSHINLKARVYDFVHWLMLIGINVGYLLKDGVTPLWFGLKLTLLAIIGWQIGLSLKKKLHLTTNEKKAGIVSACAAFILGLLAGGIRSADQSQFGWGWRFETLTAILATLIVVKWIRDDLQTISQTETPEIYPRSFFLKGILGNTLILWFWWHIMSNGDITSGIWWLENVGLTFNVLVGNIIYLDYWRRYERYCRSKT